MSLAQAIVTVRQGFARGSLLQVNYPFKEEIINYNEQ